MSVFFIKECCNDTTTRASVDCCPQVQNLGVNLPHFQFGQVHEEHKPNLLYKTIFFVCTVHIAYLQYTQLY